MGGMQASMTSQPTRLMETGSQGPFVYRYYYLPFLCRFFLFVLFFFSFLYFLFHPLISEETFNVSAYRLEFLGGPYYFSLQMILLFAIGLMVRGWFSLPSFIDGDTPGVKEFL